MYEIDISADQLVRALLRPPLAGNICLLDSCGVGGDGSDLLIAGVDPLNVVRLSTDDPNQSLKEFESLIAAPDLAAIFTISYDFGVKLNAITRKTPTPPFEPDIVLALFDCLIIHDYEQAKTFLAGNSKKFTAIAARLAEYEKTGEGENTAALSPVSPRSNFSRAEYISAVDQIKELIREGDTYQTNLTQRLEVPQIVDGKDIFLNLRRNHSAPFAAYIDRGDSVVVSASPEQFVRVEAHDSKRRIIAKPIKGTRPRGSTAIEDEQMRNELLASVKDRAENLMIVDLMRNDLGRVCEFGSVVVESLCRIEEHPTLFHLVSTVSGTLRDDAGFADILRAVFPCGSITGAPKIRTMEIIDRLETQPRGLSMGAIGCRIPRDTFGVPEIFEMSVAIRTMVIRERKAVFNVGGGIVIDSDPATEYDESMLKAKALLRALNASPAEDSDRRFR